MFSATRPQSVKRLRHTQGGGTMGYHGRVWCGRVREEGKQPDLCLLWARTALRAHGRQGTAAERE